VLKKLCPKIALNITGKIVTYFEQFLITTFGERFTVLCWAGQQEISLAGFSLPPSQVAWQFVLTPSLVVVKMPCPHELLHPRSP
jgi:hypothetical protein